MKDEVRGLPVIVFEKLNPGIDGERKVFRLGFGEDGSFALAGGLRHPPSAATHFEDSESQRDRGI